jgi:hypothetical protein
MKSNNRGQSTQESLEQIRAAEISDDMIMDFVDVTKNLNGRIGVYKINFNKNLRRFQDIAAL